MWLVEIGLNGLSAPRPDDENFKQGKAAKPHQAMPGRLCALSGTLLHREIPRQRLDPTLTMKQKHWINKGHRTSGTYI